MTQTKFDSKVLSVIEDKISLGKSAKVENNPY